MRILRTLLVIASLLIASVSQSQSTATVPRLVNFSGKASNAEGRTISGAAGVTFAIYSEQSGGAPLWIETQSVVIDAKGDYTAQLGATKPSGLPLDLFTSSEARWLGVRVNGGEEQPRVLLLSVPYALKAADAETIGGLPPSAFVLAAPATSGSIAASAAPATAPVNPSVTGTGTVGSIPLWDSSSDITSSILTQTGSGSTARLGVNITTPSATLDVKGASNFRGTVTMPSAGLATASAGKNSYPFVFATSAFNTSTKAPVLQNFRWQAEPVGNNSASTTGKLNLLFSAGTGTPAETGLSIASNGQLSFAAGQIFPGTGTITGVTAGKGLTGGGATGVVTLNLDTSKVPLLASANTFTGNQTVNGNLSSTGVITGSSYQIGSNLWEFGNYSQGSSYLGFSGNPASTAQLTTAVGFHALSAISTGGDNTAIGYLAMLADTSGSNNAALGTSALAFNTTGNYNVAEGVEALYENSIGSANTASGYEAMKFNTTGNSNVSMGALTLLNNSGGSYNTGLGTNALLANTSGSQNTATGLVSLGYNTTGNYNTATGYWALLNNTTGSYNTAVGSSAGAASIIDSNTGGFYNTFIGAYSGVPLSVSQPVMGSTAIGAYSLVGQSYSMALGGTGEYAVSVGIGTPTPYTDYAVTIDTTNSNGNINGGVVVNANGGNLYLGMTQNVHKFRVDTNGAVWADGGFNASGADFAESVAVRGSRSEYQPGDVLEIDRSARRGLALSHHPYATLVAGIYSTKPGMLASPHTMDETAARENEVPLAVVGIVPCKVSTENGAILPGDLLVTSSRAGYAMKGTDRRRLVGAVVGKALEPLRNGMGTIQVLVTLQ